MKLTHKKSWAGNLLITTCPVSVWNITIKSGLFIKLKLNVRICQLCDLRCLEDELPFYVSVQFTLTFAKICI